MSTNKRVTNKDIVKALETILSTVVETSPNGTLDKIKDKVNNTKNKVNKTKKKVLSGIKEKIQNMKKVN